MQSSSRSLSLAQLCLLAAFLAGLIYYLETGRVAVEKNVPFLGAPLHPASGKMHILVTGMLPQRCHMATMSPREDALTPQLT